jgi:chitin disaccharide deacetylase
MPRSNRVLIVNADDFGLSPGTNAGIAMAHEKGILTSASLMVSWPSAEAAAAYARSRPQLSVGLHLDLGEWVYKNDAWQIGYQVVPVEDAAAVAGELVRQLDNFKRLMQREPTHLDSHQHVHESEPVLSLCLKAAMERGIVLRNVGAAVRYCGKFYGQSNKGHPYPEGVSVAALKNVLKDLPVGVTELGCHPANDPDMEGMYRQERLTECETLCHPEILETIQAEHISLRSFLNWHESL